ncbi:phage tail spike protein [Megamonas sp.]|uniref:phage tail spike protein n=1 Tax=Megamonas sp. TaxID=2049033 RepID=UPI00258C9B20|nr:phage tail spike protein [Megamonas sp.]
MDFYFTNRQYEVEEIVSTNGGTTFEITDEEDQLDLETGARILQGTINFSPDQSIRVKDFAGLGKYILYKDLHNEDIWMTIVEIEHDPLNGEHFFVAEDAGLDLMNEVLGPFEAKKSMSSTEYFNKFLHDSGFELGINEISHMSRKLKWEGDSTALERLRSVCTQFDNAEMKFRFEINGTKVSKKYIDVYKKIGKNERETLYVNVDLNNISIKSNVYEMGNCIIATGGTPEGSENPVTLKGYKWTDPSGRYKLDSNNGYLYDTEAVKEWTRLLPGESNPYGTYIVRRKEYTSTNQKSVLDDALRELKKIAVPEVNYEVDIAYLPETVKIGDTIYLVDENDEVYLSSRILKLTYIYSTETYIATLGDYLIQSGKIDDRLTDLANQLEDEKNRKKFEVRLIPSRQYFIDGQGTITIRCEVWDGDLNVTQNFSDFRWSRFDKDGVKDDTWSKTTDSINIEADNSPVWTYQCEVMSNTDEDNE